MNRRGVQTVAVLSKGRDNNFNLLRMIAASAVLVSHAYPLASGITTSEPLDGIAPTNLGRLAVALFFAVSGFFIAKSFDRRTSLIGFVTDRVLRIYPGLIVVLLLSVLVLGPLAGTLEPTAFWEKRATWTYVLRNLSLARLQWHLPGLFSDNPTQAVNGSLWTLYYEVCCYAMVVLAGLGGLLARTRFCILLALYAVTYAAVRMATDNADLPLTLELSLPFIIGMAMYVYRSVIPLHWSAMAAGVLLVLATVGTPIYREVFVAVLAYGAFWLGAYPARWLREYNRLGDYSYGMYIYAYPVEQLMVQMLPGAGPGVIILSAFPATLFLAMLSWRFVERPALARRYIIGRQLGEWLNVIASKRR